MARAFIDESAHVRGSGLFLLAAVVVADHDAACRRGIERLRLPQQRRIHWRDESAARRDQVVAGIVGLPWKAAAVALQPVPRRRQTDARARCLGTLVAWLAEEGVSQLVIESRGPHNDREDRRAMLEHRSVAASLRSYEFARPADEPLLWLADIVAGATSAHLYGVNHRWFTVISDKVTLPPLLD